MVTSFSSRARPFASFVVVVVVACGASITERGRVWPCAETLAEKSSTMAEHTASG